MALPVVLLSNAAVTAAVSGAGAAWWLTARRRVARDTIDRAREEAERLTFDARREADAMRREAQIAAREIAQEAASRAETFIRTRRQELSEAEQAMTLQLKAVADRQTRLERLDEDLRTREGLVLRETQDVTSIRLRAEALVADRQRELERLAGLTATEAREQLIRQLESDARREAATLVKRIEAEARASAAHKAREIVAEAIQRSAAEHAIETTVSVVDLPSDDMKGRIIGREGRNIRAIETATGVELIIDDTPGAIILSSFDPLRREIARQTIERLLVDGRIHPTRIEEVVERVKGDLEDTMRREGEAAAFELGLFDLHPELIRLMGRLKFRTSYGQNVLSHSREVAYLAAIMARELGLDDHVAIRAAFLHDIGKAADRDAQGTHLEIGLDLLRRFGEREPVIQAVAAHHLDIDWPSLEAMIVQAADAISAARPGARREILESYVKRLEKLESIADSFAGVSKAFALQAGREIRIVVESESVTDEQAVWMSRDIARRIESELAYPGQIKVTVIRETRAVEYAR